MVKLRWAREFKEAKDAQIDLLKTEIQNLRELAPPKLREYLVSVRQQLEEYNDKLQQEIKQNAQQISELEKSGTEHIAKIEQLTHEKQVLEDKVINLRDVITDEVVNHLTQHLFTEFLLMLTEGTDEQVNSFLEQAMKMEGHDGWYHSETYPGSGIHKIKVRYTKNVSKKSIDEIVNRIGLKITEIQSVTGFD